MPINYTTLPVQFGAVLQILRKREALLEHVMNANDANHDRRRLTQANGFSTSDTDEARAYGAQLAHLDGPATSTLSALWAAYRAELESLGDFFGVIVADVGASEADINAGAFGYEYDVTNDVVSIAQRTGVLGALYRDMLANAQYVTANGVTFGALTAGSGNRGELSASAMTGLSHALSGTLIFEVVDESVDAPKIRVTNEFLEAPLPDLVTLLEADNDLTTDKAWEDGPLGLTATIVRPKLTNPDKTGDGGSIFTGTTTVATPKQADMDFGVLQVRVTRQAVAPIWLVEFFQNSGRTIKVGSFTTDTVVGTFAFDVTLLNGTRITGTFDRAAADVALPAAPNTDDDISFDIQTPRLGDRWTRAITNDYVGNYSTRIAKAWRFSLPVAGSTLWSDANAAAISFS